MQRKGKEIYRRELYMPLLNYGWEEGYLHFNGMVIQEDASYAAQLSLECLDSLDPENIYKILDNNPKVLSLRIMIREEDPNDLRFLIQFEIDTEGQFVRKPLKFLESKVKWLQKLLKEVIV